MRYKKLGRTGMLVSEICLGAMTFGGAGRGGIWANLGSLDQGQSEGLVKTAFEAGVNFIDTADIYSNGESEEILGRAIRNLGLPREELVIATKVNGRMTHFARPGASPAEIAEVARRNTARNINGLSRKHIMDAIDGSLRRLGLDHVDLYQIHSFDPLTPLDETLEALDSLVKAGKVRYIGFSNLPAWRTAKALGISERKALARFECGQMYYSIGGREIEREVAPLALEEQLSIIAWSPLAAGFFTGKYTRDGGPNDARRTAFDFPPVNLDRGFAILDVLKAVAAERGVPVPTVALAWALAKPWLTSLILGAKTTDQLRSNLEAVSLALSPEETARLEAVSALAPEYPSIPLRGGRADEIG